jgi:alpha-mannosidase
MGYRLYHARSGAQACKLAHTLKADRCALENDWWRIEFDPCDGHIARLYDKQRHVEVLRKGNILACLNDMSDTWSHGIEEYRVEAGRFGHAKLQIAESGDVLATVRITSQFGDSTAIQEITLYRELDCIDCRFRINWQEQYRHLKIGFETRIRDGVATYDAPYGHQTRDVRGHEEPGQQWFDLTGTIEGLPYGLAVLNDGQYGFDVREGAMRVTALRSPAYAHHDPGRFEPDAGHAIMDQGWHDIHLRLAPHTGPWQDARVVKLAWELNAPLIPHIESAHPGKAVSRASIFGTEADNVLLSVVKQSEDGAELVVRGYETAGRAAKTTLHIPFFQKTFDLSFAPHEIKTVRINPKTWTMRETNLLEE